MGWCSQHLPQIGYFVGAQSLVCSKHNLGWLPAFEAQVRSTSVSCSVFEAPCSLASRFEVQLGGRYKLALGSGAVAQTRPMAC